MKQISERWHAVNTAAGQGLVISETTGKNIAVTYNKENAPLVAAAPELYRALNNLVAWLDGCKLSRTPAIGIGPFKTKPVEYSVVTDARYALEEAKGEI